MKLLRLIKMCLNEMYSKVRIRKHLSDSLPIQTGLKQGDAISPLLLPCSNKWYFQHVINVKIIRYSDLLIEQIWTSCFSD
jgi:hypothetical protein